MNNLIELLEQIRIRPHMLLEKPSIEMLRVFITGYMCCKKEKDTDTDLYSKFQTFIEHKYNRIGTEHCTMIIRSITTSDEEAFYKFFELLYEFQQQEK